MSGFLQRVALAPPLEVSAVGLEADRILATPITDKRFERFAEEIILPPHTPETLAFLPYSVILLNNTTGEIGRFTVVWEYTDFPGNSINHTASSGNTATLHSGDSILPGVARLVSIVHRLGMKPGPPVSHVAEVWDSWKDFYARQRKVVIVVDSVIFRDGQVVGPDSSSSALLTEWTLRGQREVVDKVLGEDNGADLARVERILEEAVGQAEPLPDGHG